MRGKPHNRDGEAAASNSFAEAEVRLMATLMRQLLMGGDLGPLARTKALRGVAEKFSKMGTRLRAESAGRAA